MIFLITSPHIFHSAAPCLLYPLLLGVAGVVSLFSRSVSAGIVLDAVLNHSIVHGGEQPVHLLPVGGKRPDEAYQAAQLHAVEHVARKFFCAPCRTGGTASWRWLRHGLPGLCGYLLWQPRRLRDWGTLPSWGSFF